MGKNKLSSGLINVVTYDTDSNISLNSGSNLLMSLSGSGTVTIPGNLVVLGGISGSTAESASYSLNADKIDNLDSTQLVLTSSFNSYTSSASSSLGSLSGSVATTTSNLSSSIGDLSGSVATTTSGLSSTIGNLSSSIATTTSNLSSSIATTTSGLSGRITTIEGNYATTGSNIFVGSQVITGSLYITNDMVVQGCSCLQNITASAVSIGTNTVVLNTATPAVRFAGISVQDSGSNVGVTGSIYWDGLCNRWVYSNPSGIGYSGGLLISGPRNTGTLGDEVGTTSCALMMGQGGDHITSSAIFHYGNATCLYENSFINSSGLACFADTVCATTFKSKNLIVCEGSSNVTLSSSNNEVLRIQGLCSLGMFVTYLSGSTIIGDIGNTSQIFSSGNATGFGINARGCRTLEFGTNQTSRLSIALSGESTFACQICTTGVYTTSNSRICGNLQVSSGSGTAFALYNESSIRACISMTGNEGDLSLYGSSANKTVYLSAYYDSYFIGNGGAAKVGIGTSNPCSKLHVSGGGIVIDNNQDYRSLNSSGLGRTILYLDSSNRLLLNNDDGLIRISTSGNIRTCITGTGEAVFACQVCAPQYITTQGSSVSYASGTNYTIWNSEVESCIQDSNNPAAYTRIKTWIADRSGCATIRYTGYIQSGPTYWGYRVTRNGTSSYMCVAWDQCIQPGCASANVHGYSSYQFNVGPFLPGDCIGLDVASTGGGATPSVGQGQYIYAKEFRIFSTTPNLSAGSINNVVGDFVGIGTNKPLTTLHTTIQTCYARNGSTANSYPIATFSQCDCGGGARGLQIGVPTGGIVSPVYLKVSNTSARFSILDSSNNEDFTITGGKIGIGNIAPDTYLHICKNVGDVGFYLESSCKTSNPSYIRLIGVNSNNCRTQFQIVHRGNHSAGGYTDRVDFSMNNGGTWCESVMRFDFNGNVGMCNGTLAVSNSVCATNLNVSSVISLGGTGTASARGHKKFISAGSSFDNPTVNLISVGNPTNSVTVLKVTVYTTGFGSNTANIHTGYAMKSWAGSYACPMSVVAGFGNNNVGTIAWSGETLTYTANRISNYDSYHIEVDYGGSNGSMSASWF